MQQITTDEAVKELQSIIAKLERRRARELFMPSASVVVYAIHVILVLAITAGVAWLTINAPARDEQLALQAIGVASLAALTCVTTMIMLAIES